MKKYRENREMKHAADVLSSVLSILTIPFAFVVAYSRVELGYHSIEQVIAGAMIGLMFGSMWFLVTTRVFARQFSEMVKEEDECTGSAGGRNSAKRKRRKFGKFLRETLNMRDSSLCSNPLALSRERVEVENFAFPVKDVVGLVNSPSLKKVE